MATPINLVPSYNPAFSRGFPPSDIASDFGRNFQSGVGIGLALRGVPQTKLLQENVAQDLDNQLAAALMPYRVQGAGLQNQQAEEAILNAPINRAASVSNILGEPGTITNLNTGPVIPVDNSDMSKTLRFAAPEGGGQVPADVVSVGLPNQPGVGRSPMLRQKEEIDKDARAEDRLLRAIGAKGEIQKDVAKLKSTGMPTPNRQSRILTTLGGGGVSSDQFRLPDGSFDWNAAAVEAGRIERENTVEDLKAKLNNVGAEAAASAARLISVIESTDRLNENIGDLTSAGKAPTWWDNAVATATREPADSFFGALATQVMKETQGIDSKETEALKAVMSAALARANAGLAQTNTEMASSSAYRPLPTDSLYDTIIKLQNIRPQLIGEATNLLSPKDVLRDKLEGLKEPPKTDKKTKVEKWVRTPDGKITKAP